MAAVPETASPLRLRRIPTGVAGAVFWLTVWFGLLWLVRQVPRAGSPVLAWMQVGVGLALIALAVPLAWKIIQQRFLWSLRSKLVLTYLLIGLAPVVLFLTLAVISAYLTAGQFSIHLADTRMQQHLDEIGLENAVRVSRIAPMIRAQTKGLAAPPPPPQAAGQQATGAPDGTADPAMLRLSHHTAVYLSGVPMAGRPDANALGVPVPGGEMSMPLGLPPWATDLGGNPYRGVVLDGQDIYLVAIDQRHIAGVGILSAVTAMPVNGAFMDVVARDLGRVRLSASIPGRKPLGNLERASVYGGAEPVPANFCDLRVPFVSTIQVHDWDTNLLENVPVEVHSRPSLLYRQLFGSSLGGIVTDYIRFGLIGLCIVFGLVEALALTMALRLSGTITGSVEELYAATQRVDHGDLEHRIPALYSAKKDQLAELARSFNRMTGSLERLLVEQHEKERLQSELSIAQEVQANLFPKQVRDLPTLELHGICRPARSVSGDYYDFLVFHRPHTPEGKQGAECGVGIALGDISGKGISAALLMATLHSAVRAYRLGGEDLVQSGAGGNPELDDNKLFESPGRILALLNRHLFRSTQPAKYATLFLAHYDADTAELTYSNAGHLPPIVMARDGSMRRLECGGTVVGLIDGMRYEQETIPMRSGDILIAYSDGITEPENDFGEFGEERLLEVVSRYRDQPLHVISAQVMLALEAWIGAGEQPDDITLVLARQV
ncbi:MAG TPA: SpoIIE family protein phosphatase [Acidobacteriaceae bacterium]|jgi:sigma-B regulation protein RsbU (phosphoserine phosphatase)|nr:SpoIIE family protein phosphatase [Acidobacteriaceae bacterium]